MASIATTALDVCQMALGEISVTTTLASITAPTTKEEKVCAFHYPRVRDKLLRAHDWSWATKRAPLTQLTDHTRSGWSYVYSLPTDFLKVIDIDLGFRRSSVPSVSGNTAALCSDGRARFALEMNNSGTDRVLCTDIGSAALVYVAQVVDPTVWDVHFQEACVFALAARIAMPLSGKPDLARSALAAAQQAFVDAVQADVSESRPDPRPDPDFITGRSW